MPTAGQAMARGMKSASASTFLYMAPNFIRFLELIRFRPEYVAIDVLAKETADLAAPQAGIEPFTS